MKKNISQARAISYNVTRLNQERRRIAIATIDGDLNAFKRSRYSSEYWYLNHLFKSLEALIDIPLEFERFCWRLTNHSEYLHRMSSALPVTAQSLFFIVAMFADLDSIKSEVMEECIGEELTAEQIAGFFGKLRDLRELMCRPLQCVVVSDFKPYRKPRRMTYGELLDCPEGLRLCE